MKTSRVLGLVLVLAVCAASRSALADLPRPAPAQRQIYASVSGKVTNAETQKPVEGLELTFMSTMGILSVTTDRDGNYQVNMMGPSTYKITYKIGPTSYQHPESLEISTNWVVTYDIVLPKTPIPDPNGPDPRTARWLPCKVVNTSHEGEVLRLYLVLLPEQNRQASWKVRSGMEGVVLNNVGATVENSAFKLIKILDATKVVADLTGRRNLGQYRNCLINNTARR